MWSSYMEIQIGQIYAKCFVILCLVSKTLRADFQKDCIALKIQILFNLPSSSFRLNRYSHYSFTEFWNVQWSILNGINWKSNLDPFSWNTGVIVEIAEWNNRCTTKMELHSLNYFGILQRYNMSNSKVFECPRWLFRSKCPHQWCQNGNKTINTIKIILTKILCL